MIAASLRRRRALLFPLYSSGGLACYVKRHPVDTWNLVDNTVADASQEVVWEARPVGGHSIVRGYGPDDYGVGVGAGVAHHAHGVDRRQVGEALPEFSVEAGGPYLILQHGVGAAQDLEPLRRDVPDDPDGEPWARVGLTPRSEEHTSEL